MIQPQRALGSILLGTLLASATLTGHADACRCLEPSSAAAAYSSADAAVIANVRTVEATTAAGESEAIVEIEEAWKATMPKTLRISTGTDCAFKFAKDGSYLLFLLRDAAGKYSTERCMGNRETAKAASFLTWLRKNGEAGKVATSTSASQRD